MSTLLEFLTKSLAITQVELKKLLRDPMELLSRAVQPVLWLAVFGQVFSRVRGYPPETSATWRS
jgi:ABC-2 type transport system permease protein